MLADALDPDETYYIKAPTDILVDGHSGSCAACGTRPEEGGECARSSGAWKERVWVPACLNPYQLDTALNRLAGEKILIGGRSISRGFFFAVLEQLFGRILKSDMTAT